jgi:hypothetical protein
LDWPKLTCKIDDLCYETLITLYKTNKNKLWKQIPNQPSVKGWKWKKNKKGQKHYPSQPVKPSS